MRRPFLFVIILIILFSCSSCDSINDNGIDNICGQEPCYEGPFDPPWVDAHMEGIELNLDINLTHDNRVLETDHFLVFSDASSDEAKIQMGETAETALNLIRDLFQIGAPDLGILDLSTKIRAYSKRRDDSCGSSAYFNGFLAPAYDVSNPSCIELIPFIVKHELTHVVQFRLGGFYTQVWAWFTEGLAETVSGGVYPPIICWQEVDEWRQDPGHVNPITIQYLEQIPDYNTIGWLRREQYYPVFGVAVRYLVDPKGQGRTLIDVRNMFSDIGNGVDFATAFETHMGMSLEYYEENFYNLIQAFLPAECEELENIGNSFLGYNTNFNGAINKDPTIYNK